MTNPQGPQDEYSDEDIRPGVIARKHELIAARESGDLEKVKKAKANLMRLQAALKDKKNAS